MKKTKVSLRKDTVHSSSFHVGIELETYIPCSNGGGDHDDDSCYQSQRENLESEGSIEILQNYFSVDRSTARSLDSYFDCSQWIDDYMNDWTCDDSECPYNGNDGESSREELESELNDLTNNNSIKVVSDSSINKDSDETDAEVCWNYFASKDTLADNAKILRHLKKIGAGFNRSCGLHINLNNYLKLETPTPLHTSKLDFLFHFVADSRASSNYCSRNAVSDSEKYSMIYNQEDRLEFRFFSPTFDPEKLNHYVALANVVYRRLAGKNAKLSKKTMKYFLDKMTKVNGKTFEVASEALKAVNGLLSYEQLLNGEMYSSRQSTLEVVA